MWISPVLPKLEQPSATEGESKTFFKRDLLQYVRAYKAAPLEEWALILEQYDFSAVKVFLIASIPGRHTGEQKNIWGHMKMRRVKFKTDFYIILRYRTFAVTFLVTELRSSD